jgi:hypothetical protein
MNRWAKKEPKARKGFKVLRGLRGLKAFLDRSAPRVTRELQAKSARKAPKDRRATVDRWASSWWSTEVSSLAPGVKKATWWW